MKGLFRGVSLLLVLLLLLPALARAGDYVIGEGDTLQIAVWGVASLNFGVKVRPDGMITVPGLGEVAASSRRPRDLQKDLAEQLKTLVKSPIVTVTVTDITNSKVFIFGSGMKPVIYDITRRTSLLQILCSLADLKGADLGKAHLLRGKEKVKEGFARLFLDGDVSEDVQIEANDAIFIPSLLDRNVYVVGGVIAPRSVEYRDGITVMEVILGAGGFTKFADLNRTKIIRKEKGKEITIPVQAKRLIKEGNLSQNLKLEPGDFVVVEESIF